MAKIIKFNEVARILKPNGKLIAFGWTSGGGAMSRGFEMQRILLVPHGSRKNDTIVTVEIKSLSFLDKLTDK